MKIKEGMEGVGQLWSALTKVQAQSREICRVAGVSPEILAWLATDPRGNNVLELMVAQTIIRYRTRHDRCNTLHHPHLEFEEVVRRCNFEGRDVGVNNEKYPSRVMNRGRHLDFREVGIDEWVTSGEEQLHSFLHRNGLRPAQPLEYLHWLEINPDVGVEYPIWCPVLGQDLRYMYTCVCGGGRRGLYSTSAPNTPVWPIATMFLGVEDK